MNTKPSTRPPEPTRRRLLQVGAAGAAVVASPFTLDLVLAQGTPIKIGFLVPLSGPYAPEAQDQVRSAELAIKEFNDAGGFNGRKAELLVRDDKLNAGEAATRTLELIEKDKADFIAGSLSAATQLSMNAVTRERKVIFVSISQSDAINEIKDYSPFTFHEALNPHLTAGAVARYAFPKYGKRIAYLTADYAYGHEMVASSARATPSAPPRWPTSATRWGPPTTPPSCRASRRSSRTSWCCAISAATSSTR